MTIDELIVKLRSRVTYTLECSPEESDPAGHFSTGEDEQDAIMVADIRRDVARGSLWAWCYVVVKCHFRGAHGVDSLGGCSYKSEDDFRMSGGYFDDMRHGALRDLAEVLMADYERLRDLGVCP